MKRICLVEDETSLAEMIQLNLELEGYEVIAFDDGRKASTHFSENLNYDLFILDVIHRMKQRASVIGKSTLKRTPFRMARKHIPCQKKKSR